MPNIHLDHFPMDVLERNLLNRQPLNTNEKIVACWSSTIFGAPFTSGYLLTERALVFWTKKKVQQFNFDRITNFKLTGKTIGAETVCFKYDKKYHTVNFESEDLFNTFLKTIGCVRPEFGNENRRLENILDSQFAQFKIDMLGAKQQLEKPTTPIFKTLTLKFLGKQCQVYKNRIELVTFRTGPTRFAAWLFGGLGFFLGPIIAALSGGELVLTMNWEKIRMVRLEKVGNLATRIVIWGERKEDQRLWVCEFYCDQWNDLVTQIASQVPVEGWPELTN